MGQSVKYFKFLFRKFYETKPKGDYEITNLLGYQVKPLSKIIADQVNF